MKKRSALAVLSSVAARVLEEMTNPFAKWRDDLPGFAREVFGVTLWSKQVELAEAFCRGGKVAAKSGHKIGKSMFLAVFSWWFMLTRGDDACVLMISTTFKQVKGILWKEVRKLHRLAMRRGYMSLPKPGLDPATGVAMPSGATIVGLSADTQEGLAGYSGGVLAIVVDEASGIPDAFHETLEGNTAGVVDGGTIMMSNPTQTSGYFYDVFRRPERHGYEVFTISSEDTPNAQTGENIIPGLASRKWCESRARAWGRESARFGVRVSGKFPDQADNSVVPAKLVHEAMEIWSDIDHDTDETLFIGMDVAGFGDDETVLTPRRGMTIGRQEAWRGRDPVESAIEAVMFARRWRNRTRVIINIDVGGLGAGTAAHLRYMMAQPSEDLWWLEVIECNNAKSATDPEKFYNFRAESYFHFVDWLKNGGALPPDDDEEESLELELLTCAYKFKARGAATDMGTNVIIIESKEDIKKRLKRSPDRADSAVLSTWDPNNGAGASEYEPYREQGRMGEARGF